MPWTQSYSPLGSLAASAAVAAIPVLVLLGSLAILRVRAHRAALAGLAAALVVAIVVFGMPARLALAAAADGAAYGLFPIGWIVLAAIFVYDVSVATGQFEIVKQSIAGIADDRRIQVLLIAFGFGAFVEGAAGFGTPVAICTAMLVGLGFRPLVAAGLSLLGNTAPVAFGALGTPLVALARVTGLPLEALSAMVGRQLPFFAVLVPFWLVVSMAGWAGMLEVWPACLVAGVSFAVPQYLVSNFHGPWVVDVVAGAVSIGALVAFLRVWQPAKTWTFPGEMLTAWPQSVGAAARALTRREVFLAWSPWLFLSVFVFVWGLPTTRKFLDGLLSWQVAVPYLHRAVLRAAPVVPAPRAEDALFSFNVLSATGTGLFLSGILSGLVLGLKPHALVVIFAKTVVRLRLSLLTIAAMMAVGFVTRYSGSDATMGLAFASTGRAFPFFSALLGWLGVALTGSDTSSNVLFGNLQQVTALQVGVSPILCAASNSSGGVMGKMIDAQSIVVAGAATGSEGSESTILRFAFKNSIVLAALVGVLVLLQAYVLPGMIP
jgi:lactate permease